MEVGDSLYLVVFDIFYADALDRPDESASQTMVVRLSSSSGLHGLAVPTSLVYRGYVRGITGFYFANSDADKPTWGAASLVVEITCNPALSWVDGLTNCESNQVNPAEHTAGSSEAQQAAIVTFLRGEIAKLESNWFSATGEITDLIAGQPKVLTATGEEYLEQSSPHQRNLTPTLYAFVVSNPDIVSYGRTWLTVAAIPTNTTITVNEANRTGIRLNQRITVIGAAVWEEVRVTNVVGNVVTFTPALANGYAINSEVWITAPVEQRTIDTQIAGSFLETMRNGMAASFGMSPTMFGSLFGIGLALVGGGVVGVMVRGIGSGAMLVAFIAALLFSLLLTYIGFIPIVGLGILGVILVVMAVFSIFWKFG